MRFKLFFALLLPVMLMLFLSVVGSSFLFKAKAQNDVQFLQLPFAEEYRITSYVDHNLPRYRRDVYTNMVVFNGLEYNDCPEKGETWTTQGPYCYNGHSGTDFAMLTHTLISASAPGTVTFASFYTNDPNYGYVIVINHENDYRTFYAHLSEDSFTTTFSSRVSVGDRVESGQVIALSGNTAGITETTSPHLHFEAQYKDSKLPTDPFGWRGNTPDPLISYTNRASTCLWANEWCNETIVEDGDVPISNTRRFEQYGNSSDWKWLSSGNSWTMKYVMSGDGTNYARWIARPVLPGQYQIWAYIPGSNATTEHARYKIRADNGFFWATVDQTAKRGWITLTADTGETQFTFGCNPNHVELGNNTGEEGTTIGFDTMKFRRMGDAGQCKVYLPLLLKQATFTTDDCYVGRVRGIII